MLRRYAHTAGSPLPGFLVHPWSREADESSSICAVLSSLEAVSCAATK